VKGGAPDRLVPEELHAGARARWLGAEIHHLEETDSTNRVAMELARAGAAHGTAVIAEAQTAGRGRLGRSFFSPPHRNLYVSLVLRPQLDAADAPALVLAAAVAVAECAARLLDSPQAVEIKWPNDVLVRGRKTSGILMELGQEPGALPFLILGIGVNLNVDREEFPDEFQERATSLSAERGERVDRVAFTRDLFGTLEDVLDAHADKGLPGFRDRFEAYFRMRGRHIRIADLSGNETAGRALGIDADGALRVERDDGRQERVLAGDVTLAKEGVES